MRHSFVRRAGRFFLYTTALFILVGLVFGLYFFSNVDRRNTFRRSFMKRAGIWMELEKIRELATSQPGQDASQIEAMKGDVAALKKEVERLSAVNAMHTAYFRNEAFLGRPAPDDGQRISLLVSDISEFPDPAESVYPDHLRLMKVTVTGNRSGMQGLNVGDSVFVIAWVFRDRQLTPESGIKKGQIVSGVLFSTDEASAEAKSIQVSSTLDDLPSGRIFFLTRAGFMSPMDPQPLPGPVLSREDLIQETIQRIRHELSEFGNGNWQRWMADTDPLRKAIAETRDMNGEHGFGPDVLLSIKDGVYERDSAISFFSPLPPYNHIDTSSGKSINLYDGLKSLSDAFAKHGIAFIYVPFPCKAAIYPEYFVDDPSLIPPSGITIPQWRKYILDLSEMGVEVVDLLPVFLQYRKDDDSHRIFQYEHHWNPLGEMLGAEAIARHLRRFVDATDKLDYRIVGTPGMQDYRPLVGNGLTYLGANQEILCINGLKEGVFQPLKEFGTNSDARFLVMGDSQTLAFGKVDGLYDAGDHAKISDYVSYLLQTRVVQDMGTHFYGNKYFGCFYPGIYKNKKVVLYLHMQGTENYHAFAKNGVNFDLPEHFFD